ncbi:MAG: hypothetical protein VXZ96_00710 [Myxococcota bacterium]|nr:hypothetical protein [Myxococcota bacterium]
MFSRAIQFIRHRTYGLVLACCLAGCVLPFAIDRCATIWNRPTNWGHNAAADARRIFLAGIAARMGLDPTEPESLMQAYETPEAQVVPLNMPTTHRAGKYSDFATMYPATLAPIMMPFAKHSWTWFLYWWRYLIFGTFCVGVTASGLGAAKGKWAPIGGVLALYFAMGTPHAILDICLRIGQANLFVAGIMGLVMGLTAFGLNRSAISASLLGASVKLVPAIALAAIGLRLSLKEIMWAILSIGLIVFGVSYWTPIDRFIEDLYLIAGQQQMARSHLLINADSVLRFLEAFRVKPMAIVSVISIAIALRYVNGDAKKSAAVVSTGVALLSLWLGTAASAIMDHYSILLVPGMLFVGLWPLRENSPWWSWLFLPVIVGPSLMVPQAIYQYHELIFLFAMGFVSWVLCLFQLAVVSIRSASTDQHTAASLSKS